MANLEQEVDIGSSVLFPIQLSNTLDEYGEVVVDENGKPLQGWYPQVGNYELIKHNLTSVLLYQIGQRLRQELFGTRIHELIEEPNTQAAAHLLKKYIQEAFARWESRITSLEITSTIQNELIHILIRFQVRSSESIEDLNINYNTLNGQINAY